MTPATSSSPGPSFTRQLCAVFTIYTLSMSIGAGAGFSGVVIPQVEAWHDHHHILTVICCSWRLTPGS